VLYFSEWRAAIQVKKALEHAVLLRMEGNNPGKKKDWTIIFLLSNWSMLCYLERRETIQVKKGLAYPLSSVKLICYLERREAIQVKNHLSAVKLVNALLLRKEEAIQVKRAGFPQHLSHCQFFVLCFSERRGLPGKMGWPSLYLLSIWYML
jgi:hypothetical protein